MIFLLSILFIGLAKEAVAAGWQYKGCFRDDGEDRAIPTLVLTSFFEDNMPLNFERCKALAQEYGMDVIGVQYNSRCYICNSEVEECNYAKHGQLPACLTNDVNEQFVNHVFVLNSSFTVDGCDSSYPHKCHATADATEELRNIIAQSTTNFLLQDQYHHPAQCQSLFQESLNVQTLSSDQQVHRTIPSHLLADFTLNGLIPVVEWFEAPPIDVGNNDSTTANWNEAYLTSTLEDNYCFYMHPYPCKQLFAKYGLDPVRYQAEHGATNEQRCRARNLSPSSNYCAMDFSGYNRSIYGNIFAGQVGAVFGTAVPWLEASLKQQEMAHIVTVEYFHIVSRMPYLTTLTPDQLASRYLASNWSPVDMAFAFSTFEHTGLGRYGDILDPFGDFKAIAQVRCLLKPGGLLFLELPIGRDLLYFNVHRVYGRHRLPLLLRGWEVVDVVGEFDIDSPFKIVFESCILILRKMD